MRALTVVVWVLAGLCLFAAVRSRHRAAASHAADIGRDQRRAIQPMIEPREPGRVGPCWDDVASRLLHVGGDRWLGVGCDVEGRRRPGESPECTQVRKRITQCLHRHRRAWVPRPVAPEPPRQRDLDDCVDCGGPTEPVVPGQPVPTS